MKRIVLGIGLGILLIFIGFPSYSQAQTSDAGCCYSPNAGLVVCNLVSRNTCVDRYRQPLEQFLPGVKCTADSSPAKTLCELGCCCYDFDGKQFGELAPHLQCQIRPGYTPDKFRVGPTATECANLCDVPECRDGIDNDNDGCVDYDRSDPSYDDDCASADQLIEGNLGGIKTCFEPTVSCSITKLVVTPEKGEKKIRLRWQEGESQCRINEYSIFRCQGDSCTPTNIFKTVILKTINSSYYTFLLFEFNIIKFDLKVRFYSRQRNFLSGGI